VSSAVAYYEGKRYYAYIDLDGHVRVNGGVVDPGSNAKSGVGLAIDQDSGDITVSYTNQGNKLCFYEQPEGRSDWGWVDVGVSAK
jgi:hypothetical protein